MPAVILPKDSQPVQALSAGALRAEYAVTRSAKTGEWVALGTIHSPQPPAWVLVGLGTSAVEAVDDLRHRLERLAARAVVRRG